MKTGTLLVICTVFLALVFDFFNGFHDAANSIATVVSTRVLTPRVAVAWAAFFNFVAAFFLGTAVAKTIGKGMIDLSIVTQYVVLAGLLGAIIWDALTWWWGLPTSSSHALIGGYAGAAMARAALHRGWPHAAEVIISSGWTKTVVFIVIAPVMGLVLGFMFMVAVSWIFRRKLLLTASDTAGMMLRKRWVSLRARFTPGAS
jgi:inorganic phosphate transporter, PiT family